MSRRFAAILFVVMTAALIAVAAASRRADDRGSGGADRGENAAPRIASLSPALTRMAVDLGLTEQIVGRSGFCTDVSSGLPVVGDLLSIDLERLVELRPNLVLRQAPRDADDAALETLAARHGMQVLTVRELNSIGDIRETLDRMASMADADPAAVQSLHRRIDSALRELAGGWRDEVLLIYATEPVGVFGRGSYLGDVLEQLGARNASAFGAWSSLALEDLVRLDPPAIVLVRDRATDDDDDDARRAMGPIGRLDLRAVRDGRLAVLAVPGALTPSTAVIDAAEALGAILRRFAADEEHRP